jgi:DNA-binding response OmpR family regulator
MHCAARHEHERATMKRILLVEDDEDLRFCYGGVLRFGGYDVLLAADGQEGMALLQGQTIDLVITDLFMPVKDGLETIEAIRRLHTGFKVIVMSGGGKIVKPEYLKPMVTSLGVNRFLMKPITGDRLLAEVKGVLDCSEPSP